MTLTLDIPAIYLGHAWANITCDGATQNMTLEQAVADAVKRMAIDNVTATRRIFGGDAQQAEKTMLAKFGTIYPQCAEELPRSGEVAS